MGSTIKLGERFEEDCLNLVADCLESYHKGKRVGATRTGPVRRATCAGSGDLFYDFVRLQAAQVNGLARLGFAHADHGRRVLESWYDAFVGGGECGSNPDVEIKAHPDDKATRSLIIENRSWPEGTEVELRATCVRQVQDGKEFNHDVVFDTQKFKLNSGEQKVVQFTIALDKALFMAGRDYEMTINVLTGGSVVASRLVLVRLV